MITRIISILILAYFLALSNAIGDGGYVVYELNYNIAHRPIIDKINKTIVQSVECKEKGDFANNDSKAGESIQNYEVFCDSQQVELKIDAIETYDPQPESYKVIYTINEDLLSFDWGSYRIIGPVYKIDLNGDDLADYIHVLGDSTNGLGTEQGWICFLLSSQKGYKLYTIEAWSMIKEDIFRLPNKKEAFLMHTLFVRGEKGKDGKLHNYWVYNMLKFEKDSIESANDDFIEFPLWILYTRSPNHKQTDQLTEKQKKKLLEKRGFGWLYTNLHNDGLLAPSEVRIVGNLLKGR